MPISHTLGFPPLGAARELKRATEGYWSGKVSRESLLSTGAELRARHWRLQRDAGIDLPASNDFSFYDRVLDTCTLVGAVPARYGWAGTAVDLDTYFAMARGVQSGGRDVTAMEMTKWFDTNYHYLVPEFSPDQSFRLASTKPVDEFVEAQALGIRTKPVLVGPVTFLLLGKGKAGGFDRLDLLDRLLPVYAEVLGRLAAAGAPWVQLDEPALALDRTPAELERYRTAYGYLAERSGGAKILVATYSPAPRQSLHCAGPADARLTWTGAGAGPARSGAGTMARRTGALLGVVDGRNVWRTDLEAALPLLERAAQRVGSGSLDCTLLLAAARADRSRSGTHLDPELRSWLAFAKQKLGEVGTLTRAVREGVRRWPRCSRRVDRPPRAVRPHSRTTPWCANGGGGNRRDLRRIAYLERRTRQLTLPLYPTTTIGSFPQTADVRAARRRFLDGGLSAADYERFIEDQITKTLGLQEDIGLDVLVHGEFERNDMVEYFGEQLAGFVFTEHGWVQSYGTRYVKPPIIYGDVARPGPMTVRWSAFAQSKTERPVKGMLTGPSRC
jgi:5-methyltetrahydropteroyltriglutamate--homocysteine methyltransferase